MRKWLRTLMTGGSPGHAEGVASVELLVVEGPDTGQQFTIDRREIEIGRGGSKNRGIVLHDPSVSFLQAVISRQPDGYVIDHCERAANPTLIDGVTASAGRLERGKRIRMGHTILEVRDHAVLSPGQMTILLGAEPDASQSDEEMTTQLVTDPNLRTETDIVTVVTGVEEPLATLEIERGEKYTVGSAHSYPLHAGHTTLGRSPDVDIQIIEAGISRRHAELVAEDGNLVLFHRSKVNSTRVNNRIVEESIRLKSGDVIQLASEVSFVVQLRVADEKSLPTGSLPPGSLQDEMERKLALDRRIEERFTVDGSFLDVDVVNSYGMKSEGNPPEHIILSFERFRSFVGRVIEEFSGHVLNSNGDELMCYFERAKDAIEAGSAILERLDDFNLKQNLLSSPFRFRIGIHTGQSLVDFDRGVAYSAILDIAGHLQKQADSNGMVISQQTLERLEPGLPFESAGTLDREGIEFHRLSAHLRPGKRGAANPETAEPGSLAGPPEPRLD